MYALALGYDSEQHSYKQSEMQHHLLSCLKKSPRVFPLECTLARVARPDIRVHVIKYSLALTYMFVSGLLFYAVSCSI